MKKKNKLPGQLGTLLKYAFLIAGAQTMLFPFLWMILTAFKTLDESIRIAADLVPEGMDGGKLQNGFRYRSFRAVFHRHLHHRDDLHAAGGCGHGTGVLRLFRSGIQGEEILVLAVSVDDDGADGALDHPELCHRLPSGLAGYLPGHYYSNPGQRVLHLYAARIFYAGTAKILYKAAKIDGCSDWRYLWKVMVPMSKNAIATISILHFITTWNSFLWPLMVTNSPDKRVLTTGLMYFNNDASSFVNLQMAGACVVILPMVKSSI